MKNILNGQIQVVESAENWEKAIETAAPKSSVSCSIISICELLSFAAKTNISFTSSVSSEKLTPLFILSRESELSITFSSGLA